MVKILVPWKGCTIINKHVKYERSIAHQVKVMANVKFFYETRGP